MACQYGFDNVWSQQRYAQHAAVVGWIDVFGFGNFLPSVEVLVEDGTELSEFNLR